MNVFELIRTQRNGQNDSVSLEDVAASSANTTLLCHRTESTKGGVSNPLSTEERKALQDQWHDLPLIELLPVDRRREAQEILNRSPKLISVLEMCKRGVYDSFAALELLGMSPFGDFPGFTHSCYDCQHFHASQVPAGNYCRRGEEAVKLVFLDGCDHYEKR